MAAEESLGLQFNYEREKGSSVMRHFLEATTSSGDFAGSMTWSAPHGVHMIMTHPDYQRQGVATSMWQEASRLSGTSRQIPAPKHSPDRTDAGDAWARKVGGRLPRRWTPPNRDYTNEGD